MYRNLRKALFIVNKHAGIGYQSKLEASIIETCEKNNVPFTIEFTQHRGHAVELAKGAEENGYGQVIAVGGDGTLNEVARGLIHGVIPMGIIPRGSGNGLARHLGISLNIHQAIAQVFESRVLLMDVFKVNEKLSLNVSGIGFDGHITNQFGVKSTRGLLGYVTLSVKEFLSFEEFNTTIVTRDKTYIRDAFVIAIANSSQYGNNARIAPAASVCDGLLDINILKKIPFYRLDFLYALFSGMLGKSSFCEILEAPYVEFRTRHPVAYHVDGEACGVHDSFQIELIPGALQVLVPDIDSEKIL